MRKAIISYISTLIIVFISWAIPYYFQVNEMITPENSHWLLYGSYIGAFIIVCLVLRWGNWNMVKRMRLQKPIRLISGTSEANPTWLEQALISDRQELADRINILGV